MTMAKILGHGWRQKVESREKREGIRIEQWVQLKGHEGHAMMWHSHSIFSGSGPAMFAASSFIGQSKCCEWLLSASPPWLSAGTQSNVSTMKSSYKWTWTLENSPRNHRTGLMSSRELGGRMYVYVRVRGHLFFVYFGTSRTDVVKCGISAAE